MPLPERVIEPVSVCRGTLQLPVPDELEGVTNGSLANITRQLSSLSKHAEEMFANLFNEAEGLALRGTNLQVVFFVNVWLNKCTFKYIKRQTLRYIVRILTKFYLVIIVSFLCKRMCYYLVVKYIYVRLNIIRNVHFLNSIMNNNATLLWWRWYRQLN